MTHPLRTSRLLTRTYTATALFVLAMTSSTVSHSLNILLANDDGCTYEAINVLADALEAAGHTVTMVAPSGNQSGSSARQHFLSAEFTPEFTVTTNGIDGTATSAANRQCVNVTEIDPTSTEEGATVTVSASPVDSLRVGLNIVMAGTTPDLVVSGPNEGENLGDPGMSSGTLGIVKWSLLEGIPAIGVSVGKNLFGSEPNAEASAFVVGVISELVAKQRSGQPLLPAFTGLSINYPSMFPEGVEAIQGVRMTQIRNFSTTQIGPAAVEDDEGATSIQSVVDLDFLLSPLEAGGIALGEEDATNEGESFAAGYITISSMDADQNASRRKQALIDIKLRDLEIPVAESTDTGTGDE